MFEVIQNLADLQELRSEWNRLPGALQNPMLTHEWLLSAAEAFHAAGSLHILTLRDDGRIRAIAPLASVTRRGWQRLELIGAASLHEPSGLLYDTNESLWELCRVLANLRFPTALQRVPSTGTLESHLRAETSGRGRLVRIAASPSPVIPISTSWDSYYATLSSRRRYDYRRARGRLAQRGRVTVEIHNPEINQLPSLLAEACRVESSGWKGQMGGGLMVNERLSRFITTYASRISPLGNLRVCFLRVDGTAIATQVAVLYANRWWVLKVGFDEQWGHYSPGMQLTMDTVRHAFDARLEAYEFLGTPEPWLRIWTQEEHPYSTLLYYPSSLAGIGALAIDTMAWMTKRTRHILSGPGTQRDKPN